MSAVAVTHCCARMQEAVSSACLRHPDRTDCPDALLGHWPESDRYGLLIHDGGASMVMIDYCPFCGAALATADR